MSNTFVEVKMDETNKLEQREMSERLNKDKPTNLPTMTTTSNTLFKRVKNYIILAMLILIFVNTLIVTIKTELSGQTKLNAAGLAESLELATKVLNFAPNLGAIHADLSNPSAASIANLTSLFYNNNA